jgi:hypothetical protein
MSHVRFVLRALERRARSDDHFTEAKELEPPCDRIAIREEHISDQTTKLNFTNDHLQDWTKRNIRVTKHGVDQPLFTITPKSWSSSSRRELQDGTGLPLMDIRGSLTSKSKVWYCQLPGEQPGPSARRGRHILEAGPLGWMSDAIDVRLNGVKVSSSRKADDDAPCDPVVLQVRGQKHTSRIITRVIYNGQHIASFRRFQLDERSIKEDWFQVLEATVAPNVDLTLVGFSHRTALFLISLTWSRSP